MINKYDEIDQVHLIFLEESLGPGNHLGQPQFTWFVFSYYFNGE